MLAGNLRGAFPGGGLRGGELLLRLLERLGRCDLRCAVIVSGGRACQVAGRLCDCVARELLIGGKLREGECQIAVAAKLLSTGGQARCTLIEILMRFVLRFHKLTRLLGRNRSALSGFLSLGQGGRGPRV